jgi:hypothetical protein
MGHGSGSGRDPAPAAGSGMKNIVVLSAAVSGRKGSKSRVVLSLPEQVGCFGYLFGFILCFDLILPK